MTGFSVPRKWLWPLVAGVVLVAAMIGYAVVSSRGGISGLTGSEPVKSTGSKPSTGTQETTSVTGPGTAGSGDTAGKPAPAGTAYVKVFWWNSTERRPPEFTVVSWAGGSWSPNSGLKSQSFTIGPFPVGKALQLTVNPDGPTGPGRVVPFIFGKRMISGSERDAIHIELRDDNLRVLGNAVRNFERNYARK